MDLLTAPAVRAHLCDVAAVTGCVVCVDLRPVTFFDCSYLDLTLEARSAPHWSGAASRWCATARASST
ncbi:hypothetical protein DMH15_12485 [Streptomyces sp. WAC 06725]|nr:hypothetical protein DMH15_12485 [Streptomyces sp. WAC 06725]